MCTCGEFGKKSSAIRKIPVISKPSGGPDIVSNLRNEKKVRNRIFFKLLGAFVLVIAATAVAIWFFNRQTVQTPLRQEIERNLKQKTLMFANRVNTARQYSLRDMVSQEGQAAGAQATMIDVTGRVLADSEVSTAPTENLARSPEFVQALKGEVGTEERPCPGRVIRYFFLALT